MVLAGGGIEKQLNSEGKRTMHSRPLIGLLCGTLVALSAAMAGAQQLPAPESAPAKMDKSRTSYAIGVDIGRSMKRQEVEIDPQVIAQGIADAMAGGKLKLSDEEIRQTLMEMQKAVAAKMPQIIKREGEAFLAENKKKEGVQTTASGLQYKVVHAGTGATPKKTDVVTTHYRGTLLDGTVFDSSYDRNEPAKFPVDRVNQGLDRSVATDEGGR
jgi:FKBP-type peptidyl-prolyl cis-trans isomerase FklB